MPDTGTERPWGQGAGCSYPHPPTLAGGCEAQAQEPRRGRGAVLARRQGRRGPQ